MLRRTWGGVADQATTDLWAITGLVGSLVLVLLLVAVIVRAFLQRRHYRAINSFGESDRRAVEEAVAAAEMRTVGEILPVVVERSARHPEAEWMAALCLLFAGAAFLVNWLPRREAPLLVLCVLAVGVAGFGIARWLPGFKRRFILENRATVATRERALREFYASDLHRTEEGTGILVFVSLLEHRVVVLGDAGIDRAVTSDLWDKISESVLAGIRNGSLRNGLIDGIGIGADVLARHYPWREGSRDEIPNRVVVRKE